MSSRKSRRSLRRSQRAIHALLQCLEPRILLASQPAVFAPVGIGMGGTCYNAVMNPLNPNEFYLETDMGEVWHTLDDGLHWTTLNMQTQLRSNAQTDPVQFTSNTNIQYAITGQTTPMMTTDDGQTWTQLAGWSAIKATDGGNATHLIVDPNSSNRLVMIEQKTVGSNYDWWVYYSTNSGTSFSLINSDTTGTSADIPWSSGSFWNGNNIYFATFKGLYTSSNGGSTWSFTSSASLSKPNDPNGFNVDSGQTFSKIVSFTGSSNGTTTRLWAIAWDGSVNTVSATASGFTNYSGLYTSTDGGVTWSETEGGVFGQQGVKIITPRFVEAADNDITDVWIGGGDNSAATSPVVYKSTNAGTSFSKILLTGYDTTNFPGETPNQNVYTRTWGTGGDFSWGYLGVTTITFTVDRANSNIINFTCMGTLFGTIDGGSNWYDLEAGGPNQLPNTAWNPEGYSITKGTAYGNSQANETSAWNLTFIDPNTIFIDDTDVAGQYTTNDGSTWSYLQTPGYGIPNTFYDSVYVPSTDTIYAVTSDKHDIFTNNIDDGEIKALGSNYIVESTNHGATWSIVHTFPTAAPARTLAIDPNNPNVAYVGLDNSTAGTGGIWKTSDLQDGASSVWTNLSTQPHRDIDNNGTQDFADFYPDQITILNDGTIIAVSAVRYATSGYLSPNGLSYTAGVWVSTDGGNTWSDRSSVTGDGTDIYNNGHDMYYTQGNLLTTEAFSVTVDPNDPTQNTWFASTYYFGTQAYGTIYKTTNRGQSWSVWMQMPQTNTPPYTVGQAENLWIQPGGKIMLATTKNGLFYCPDYTAATPMFYAVQDFPFNGNPSFEIASDPFNSNKVYVTTFGDGVWTADVSQLGVPGVVSGVGVTTKSSSEALVNWTITAPTGTSYIIQTSTDDMNWSNAATVPNWQETSYLVTGLSANTLYYFRVLSVDGAGDSNPSLTVTARTDATPGVTAIEETTQAAGALNGTGSGSGWNGNWVGNNAADTVVSGNINNSNPPDNTGNYIQITSSGVDAYRLLNNTVGTSGSVLWLGFEIGTATASNLLLGDTTNGIAIGTQTYSSYASLTVFAGGVATYHQVGSSFTSGNHFLAARLEFRTDGTVSVNLYIDPKPGLQYPTNPTTWASSWNGIFNTPLPSGTNKITLEHPSSGTAKYDEIRLGGTYADVAPKSGITAPAAPSGIAGTVASPNEVDLSWTNNATNQEGFTVEEYNGSAWSTIERLLNTSTSGTVINYSVTNLAASSTYQFRVSAFDIGGSSATNATSNLTTLANPPAAVTNLAVAVSNGQFNLTWSDVSGETGYTLQYADATGLRQPYNDGELPWNSVSLAANTISYSFTTLSTNRIYYFRIIPYNAAGNAFCSNLVHATAFPAPPGVAASPITDTQALVSWTDNIIGESGFTVQYSLDGSNWTTGATTGANVTQAAVSGLSVDTVYYFRVQAFATGSTGNWSSTVSTRTFSTLSGQIAYDGFDYAVGGGTYLNGQGSGLGWTNNWTDSNTAESGINSGSLSYSAGGATLNTTDNDAWFWQGSNATRTLNYTLGQDNTSLWVAFAINQHVTGGTGSLYGNLQLSTDANNYLDLGSPWNGYYDGIAKIGGTTYYMQGGSNPVAPVDGTTAFLVYRIDFAATGTADSVRFWVNPTPGTQPSDASANSTWTLPTGVNFSFPNSNVKITSNSYYNKVTFDELRFGTTYGSVAPVTLPTAPSGLSATPTSSSINLSWTDNSSNESGFNVQHSTDQVNWATVQTLGANTTSWSDSSISSNTTYYYRVSSYDATGDSMPSATAGALSYPSVPSSVTATASTSAISINVSWSETNGASTYSVRRSTDQTNWTTVASSIAVTNWTDNTVGGNTTYYYQVNATNASGTSGMRLRQHLDDPRGTLKPVRDSGTTTITLNWTDPSPTTNITGYNVYRSTDGVSWGSALATVSGATATTYTDSSPSLGVTYYYEVTAYDATGNSAPSNIANTTIVASAVVTIVATNPNAAEDSASGPVPGTFTITRTGSTSGSLVVNYTISGTATNGTDYQTLTGSVTIANGSSTATITVTPYRDDIPEPTETVILTLAAGTGYSVGSPSSDTVNIADNGLLTYEGFNYTAGNGSNWNGQNGGTGWSSTWSVSSTTNATVNSGSLTYSSGSHGLITAGNDVSMHIADSATRTVNFTLGTDNTSLWVGFEMNQHISGGTGTLYGNIQLGSDANNHLQLGSPWNGYYDGQAYIGGTRYYMHGETGASPAAVADNVQVFLVYRIDFNTTGTADQVRMWVNPVPGTIPTDASANVTWTLPAGVNFAFTNNNIVLNDSSYYNLVTFDEIRLGSTYYSVAPDPLLTPAASRSASLLTSAAFNSLDSSTIDRDSTASLGNISLLTPFPLTVNAALPLPISAKAPLAEARIPDNAWPDIDDALVNIDAILADVFWKP